MKSGYTSAALHAQIHDDDVFTWVEDVEAWLLLVKHRNIRSLLMPVTGWGAFLKFVDGSRRCEACCACSVSTTGCFLDGHLRHVLVWYVRCPAFGETFYAAF